MANINCQGYGASGFDTGAITVNDTVNWVSIGTLQLGGGKEAGLMTLLVGAGGAIAHLKLTRADKIGGLHIDWLVDTDFNTATDEMIDCVVPGSSPPNIYQLAASGKGQIKLNDCRAVCEIGIWAKSATVSTTVEVTGNFMSAA